VTPSFNQAAFLAGTMESVLAQNYPALEYVIVDGGSTDGSIDLIRSQSSRMAWWCSEPDGGMYDGLNKGFAHTTGEIMGWLNSDDLHFPWTLRTVSEIFALFPQVEWLTSQTVGAVTAGGVCSGMTTIGGFSREAFSDGCYLPGGAIHYGWIPQEATFWRRSLWEKAGGRLEATLRLAGDFELWARFYEHAELVATPTPLAGFRTHANQLSRAMDRYLVEANGILAAFQHRYPHKSSLIRRWLLRTQIAAIPGLRNLTVHRFGYTGCVARPDGAGEWHLQNHRFL
jgi:glycosyltransferase involved in cell wall biosynthesis